MEQIRVHRITDRETFMEFWYETDIYVRELCTINKFGHPVCFVDENLSTGSIDVYISNPDSRAEDYKKAITLAKDIQKYPCIMD